MLTHHQNHNLPFSQSLAQELLTTYGSPLYVYQSDRLRQTIKHITEAIPYQNTRFHFASVTNSNISLLQIFRNEGWGLHANTPGDIYLGLQAGFHPSQIVYSGSNLSRNDMEQIFQWGVTRLNLDSLAQLQLCCEIVRQSRKDAENLSSRLCVFARSHSQIQLGMRLNLPEITGDSRIGVRPAEFAEAIAICHKANLKLTGLHFYRGTGTNATKAFTQVMDTVIAIAQQLPDWQILDFGGGFGYPYNPQGAAFNWEEFGLAISQKLNRIQPTIELVIEPGRAAIAGCGTLLARVVSIKWQAGKQIVGVDTTVANLSVPAVHGGDRQIVTWIEKTPLYPTDVCGNTTYSRDYLGRNCQLPPLQIGDAIAILDTGAYGYAMSSHFLHRPRPAEVLIENNTHRLIRQREDYSILLNGQIFN
jgi:diaminopimelate decarboxylase